MLEPSGDPNEKPQAPPSDGVPPHAGKRENFRGLSLLSAAGFLLIVALLSARFFFLEHRGFWLDEFATLNAMGLSYWEMLAERARGGHVPLYFFIASFWTRLFGTSEWALRLPSAMMVVPFIVYCHLLARNQWRARAAFWCTLFAVLHQRIFWASLEARPYALIMLCAMASLHALVRALQTSSRGWWWAYSGWTIAGLLAQASYALVFFPQMLVLLLWLRKNALTNSLRAKHFLLGLSGFAAVVFILLKVFSRRKLHKDTDLESGDKIGRVLKGAVDVFWGTPRYSLVWVALLILLAGFFTWLAWRGHLKQRNTAAQNPPLPSFALVCVLAFVPFVLISCASFVWENISAARYYSMSAGGACMILGVAVGVLDNRWRRMLAGLGVATILAATSVQFISLPGCQLREAIRQVKKHRAPDEPVLFLKFGKLSALMCDYYGLDSREVTAMSWSRGGQKEAVEELAKTVRGKKTFWLLVYETSAATARKMAKEATGNGFAPVPGPDFIDSAAIRYEAKSAGLEPAREDD